MTRSISEGEPRSRRALYNLSRLGESTVKLCHFYLAEPDARAEVPWQSHGAGSTVLYETNGNRCGVYSLPEGGSSGFEARQHVPVGPYDRQDR